MIQVDERELQILIELADRATKTLAEQYALAIIVAKLNDERKRQQSESGGKALG